MHTKNEGKLIFPILLTFLIHLLLRFHWPEDNKTSVYRFTRALFGLTCSPFLLNGVLGEHLKSWETKYPSLVDEIRKGIYVDDLMRGGARVDEVNEQNR